jgi:pimeloyl-ACP methyl ester carboxylesterase
MVSWGVLFSEYKYVVGCQGRTAVTARNTTGSGETVASVRVRVQQVTSADGTEIAYERHGEGPAVICLHGTGVTRQLWRPLVGHLADDATLVMPDRRGRGESGDAETYAFERELDDVAALAEPVDRPVLFGSSFGGLVAMSAADRLDIAGLVLYEPPMPAVTVEEPYESIADRMERLLESGEREAAVKLFFEEATGAENVERWPIWPDCVALAETILRESAVVEEFHPDDVSVSVPALLLTGERSPAHLRRSVSILDERLPDTRVVEIEGASHAGIATAPAQVAAAVRDFL